MENDPTFRWLVFENLPEREGFSQKNEQIIKVKENQIFLDKDRQFLLFEGENFEIEIIEKS